MEPCSGEFGTLAEQSQRAASVAASVLAAKEQLDALRSEYPGKFAGFLNGRLVAVADRPRDLSSRFHQIDLYVVDLGKPRLQALR